jgi:hypothetical protein
MYKNAMKCNKTQIKWCINKHGASKIIDTFEMYHTPAETSNSKSTIQQSPTSKSQIKAMPAMAASKPEVKMSAGAMPAKTMRLGKVLARLVVAIHPAIMAYLGIQHPINLVISKVPHTRCSSKMKFSPKIAMMMVTQPWREPGINNPTNKELRVPTDPGWCHAH